MVPEDEVGIGANVAVDSRLVIADGVWTKVEVCGISDGTTSLSVVIMTEVDCEISDELVWFLIGSWRRSSEGISIRSTKCCLLDKGVSEIVSIQR